MSLFQSSKPFSELIKIEFIGRASNNCSTCLDFCDYFLPKVNEYEKLITQNPIFLKRVEGIGIVEREEAINWGLSGPMLRASGVQINMVSCL